jgi:hypothetical protein
MMPAASSTVPPLISKQGANIGHINHAEPTRFPSAWLCTSTPSGKTKLQGEEYAYFNNNPEFARVFHVGVQAKAPA